MLPLLIENVMKNIISALTLLVTLPAFCTSSLEKISSFEEGKWVAEWVNQDDAAQTKRLFTALKGNLNKCVVPKLQLREAVMSTAIVSK